MFSPLDHLNSVLRPIPSTLDNAAIDGTDSYSFMYDIRSFQDMPSHSLRDALFIPVGKRHRPVQGWCLLFYVWIDLALLAAKCVDDVGYSLLQDGQVICALYKQSIFRMGVSKGSLGGCLLVYAVVDKRLCESGRSCLHDIYFSNLIFHNYVCWVATKGIIRHLGLYVNPVS